jgi:hypothetical protein
MPLDSGHYIALTAAAGKGFIMLAGTIPAPGTTTGVWQFWRLWSYNFLQEVASNAYRIQK